MSRPTRSPGRCWRGRRGRPAWSIRWPGATAGDDLRDGGLGEDCGFEVVAAGKGTRYHPTYHRSTPDTVWDILDQYLKIEDRAAINPKMFNSFLERHQVRHRDDGGVQRHGPPRPARRARFPPASRFEQRRRLQAEGRRRDAVRQGRHRGHLLGPTARAATCPIISPWALCRDRERQRLRPAMRARVQCLPDRSGRYSALYRPTHMIGLELGVSVASAALRRERPARRSASTRT